MADWGLVRRVFQLALILMVGALTYYLATAGWLGVGPDDFLTLFNVIIVGFTSLVVGFGTAVTFWSFRGRAWDLVALALIFLVAAYFSLPFWFWRGYDFLVVWVIGLLFAPGLTAAAVLFLLRRARLRLAISISVSVMLLMGFAIWMFIIWGFR